MAHPRRKDIEMDDFSKEARDPESLKPLTRGFSWGRNWTAQTDRSDTNCSTASIESSASHWSLQWIIRWSPASKRKATTPSSSSASLSGAQKNFIVSILGEIPCAEQPEIHDACTWYIESLERKIAESWVTLFRPVLKDTDPVGERPRRQDLASAFEIMTIIVAELERENLALIELVDRLYNEDLLEETDEERSCANQMVFAMFGWISGLYPARPDPEREKLQIIKLRDGQATRGGRWARRAVRRSRMKTFISDEQTLEFNAKPLHELLGQFGKIIPQRTRESVTGQSTPATFPPIIPDERWIELSLLCFHTLNKVAHLKIEWVDSLSLHLEFDSSAKVLKIFRLPSLCLIMCSCKKLSPLSQIFLDSNEYDDDEDARDFYKEVLLSYRLIFQQDHNSYNDFNQITQIGDEMPREYHDALLLVLCGQHWESPRTRCIYEMIEAEVPSAHYSPSVYFPFLGERLLEVQRYVRGHKPNTFWALWNDRRDTSAWWTFWLLGIVACTTLVATLLLGILQLVVGILQVMYTKEQLSQSTGSLGG
ncbi:hypothetical protein EG329_005716 [Mollisiaceae sp. DMI_Dod_QoI]|nr:hypothetical protein EG329_005716 [Helotiales sp. DMI_Dod_QoI]